MIRIDGISHLNVSMVAQLSIFSMKGSSASGERLEIETIGTEVKISNLPWRALWDASSARPPEIARD